jgi:hypothetical protein
MGDTGARRRDERGMKKRCMLLRCDAWRGLAVDKLMMGEELTAEPLGSDVRMNVLS